MRRALPLAAVLGLAACALQPHVPPTASPARAQQGLLSWRLDDDALRAPLASAGVDVRVWPLTQWDTAALQALARLRHPELQLARARLAEARVQQAAVRPTPWLPRGIELTGDYRDMAQGGGASPWSLGAVLEFPLSDLVLGVSRRQARQDAAAAAGDEALQQAAQVAWQVHARVRDACAALAVARLRATLAEQQWADLREALVAWQNRLRLGAATASDLTQVRHDEAEARRGAELATQAEARARGALIGAVGLTATQAEGLRIAVDLSALMGAVSADPSALQEAALLDRLDVRAGVARYAAADAALRLALSRQLPEIALKPGWAWDQGDRRWSLGVGLTLPEVGGNRQAIDQARAHRDAQAAEFAVLQLQALSALEAARTAVHEADGQQRQATLALDIARAQVQRTQNRLNAGSIDRLVLLESRAAVHRAQGRWIDARGAAVAAHAALEDAVQRPLDQHRVALRLEARRSDPP